MGSVRKYGKVAPNREKEKSGATDEVRSGSRGGKGKSWSHEKARKERKTKGKWL